MFNSDLTLVSNQGSLTAPGAIGSKVFNLVTSKLTGGSALRRVSSDVSAGLVRELTMAHTVKGTGFSERHVFLVKLGFRRDDTDLASTGGVVPQCGVTITGTMPTRSGGYIVSNDLKDLLGFGVHLLCTAGNIDKLRNQEL